MRRITLFALIIIGLGLSTPSAATAAPPQVILDGGCDPDYNPDCLMDESNWSMTADYDTTLSYSNGAPCQGLNLRMTRSGTYWTVWLSAHACIRNGQVIELSQVFPTAWASLPLPLAYTWSLNWDVKDGPHVCSTVCDPARLPAGVVSTWATFKVQFCAFVHIGPIGCSLTVTPYLWLYVYGDGRTICYSDRSVVFGCRGTLRP